MKRSAFLKALAGLGLFPSALVAASEDDGATVPDSRFVVDSEGDLHLNDGGETFTVPAEATGPDGGFRIQNHTDDHLITGLTPDTLYSVRIVYRDSGDVVVLREAHDVKLAVS